VDDCSDLLDAFAVCLDSVLCQLAPCDVFGTEFLVQHCLCLESQSGICADEFLGSVYVSGAVFASCHAWVRNVVGPGS
jgi:hypothetical protein